MEIKTVGDNLVVTMPLNAVGTESKSGKSKVLATTHGFTPVEGKAGVSLSLNLIKKV